MLEITGSHAIAKVFAELVDETSLQQVKDLCNQPYVEDSKIRMMPDMHAGIGCTVGTTMTISDKVCPNVVGVDIGCGISCIRLKESNIDFKKLDSVIEEYVPTGFNIHGESSLYVVSMLERFELHADIDLDRASRSAGTLGGGNHFIEVDYDNEGCLYLIIHSGSRKLGFDVCNYYQKQAYEQLVKQETKNIIDSLKQAGRQSEISHVLQNHSSDVDKDSAYVEGDLFNQYIQDMKVAQKFASYNRRCIAVEIMSHMKLHAIDSFETVHNYIDTDSMIVRKGAVSAKRGERFILPVNMKDGSLLCVGKGNDDWNCSAPHGAGRVMSRKHARESLDVSDFEDQMKYVYTSCVGESTIDESPDAYKPMEYIVDSICDTCEVVNHLRPLYNYKAH